MTANSHISAIPSRKFVDYAFAGGHLTTLIAFQIPNPEIAISLVVLALAFFFFYVFSITSFAGKMGRSRVLWGGTSLLLMVPGTWLTYAASFFIRPAASMPVSKSAG